MWQRRCGQRAGPWHCGRCLPPALAVNRLRARKAEETGDGHNWRHVPEWYFWLQGWHKRQPLMGWLRMPRMRAEQTRLAHGMASCCSSACTEQEAGRGEGDST
jgi:hypothetical protein